MEINRKVAKMARENESLMAALKEIADLDWDPEHEDFDASGDYKWRAIAANAIAQASKPRHVAPGSPISPGAIVGGGQKKEDL